MPSMSRTAHLAPQDVRSASRHAESMLTLLPQFRSALTSCQWAKAGAWETAWSFPSGSPPSRSELVAYLGQSTEIAFEAFFGSSFFGARITGSPVEIEAFSVKCLQAVRAQNAFFDVFFHELGCPAPNQLPAFAEIGCVNAWRSVGAFRIDAPQRASSQFAPLWHAVLESPVGRDSLHAKAIEFAFESPLSHWFGVPVSVTAGSNQVSETLLRQALTLVAHPAARPSRDAP